MSHFGDLLRGKGGINSTPKSVKQEVVSANNTEGYSKQALLKLNKKELEELGREHGIELDRRISHAKLVVQLKSFIDSKS
tara:strand:+ start:330 stop:569 length:240 start_codon:yes stop_codon:yes gene_type:complete